MCGFICSKVSTGWRIVWWQQQSPPDWCMFGKHWGLVNVLQKEPPGLGWRRSHQGVAETCAQLYVQYQGLLWPKWKVFLGMFWWNLVWWGWIQWWVEETLPIGGRRLCTASVCCVYSRSWQQYLQAKWKALGREILRQTAGLMEEVFWAGKCCPGGAKMLLCLFTTWLNTQ